MNKIDFIQKEMQKHKNWLLKELYTRNTDLFNIDDLLYLFPNNKLKHAGIAMKRGGSKKRKHKVKIINSQPFFNLLEDVIEETLVNSYVDNVWYDKFVNFKYMSLGESNTFYIRG